MYVDTYVRMYMCISMYVHNSLYKGKHIFALMLFYRLVLLQNLMLRATLRVRHIFFLFAHSHTHIGSKNIAKVHMLARQENIK